MSHIVEATSEAIEIMHQYYNGYRAPIFHNGHIYFSGINALGHLSVIDFDVAAQTFVTSPDLIMGDHAVMDAHNSGSIYIDPDGYIVVAYKSHGGANNLTDFGFNQYLYYARSDVPYDVSSFTVRSLSFGANNVWSGEYVAMFYLPAANQGRGRTFVFGRRYLDTTAPMSSSHGNYTWVCWCYSDDHMRTVTYLGDRCITYQMGCTIDSNDLDRLYFACFSYISSGKAHDNRDEAVWYMEMDADGNFYRPEEPTTVIANLYDTLDIIDQFGTYGPSMGIQPSEMSLAIPQRPAPITNSPLQVGRDANGRPMILSQRSESPADPLGVLTHVYREIAIWNGTSWDVTGFDIGHQTGKGACWDVKDPTRVYTGAEQTFNSGVFEVECWVTTDNYATWEREAVLTAPYTLRNIVANPMMVRNYPGNGRMLLFSETTAGAPLTQVKRYLLFPDPYLVAVADGDSVQLTAVVPDSTIWVG